MLSNKLTFSLASLVILLVLGFAATPVIAHPNVAGQDLADTHATEGHKHPTVMVSVKDADPTMAGLQVVDVPETGTDSVLTIVFDVVFTLSEMSAAAPFTITADNAASATDDVDFISYNSGFGAIDNGTLSLGALTVVADSDNKKWMTTATITLSDDADAETTDAQQRAAVETAGVKIEVRVPNGAFDSAARAGDLFGQSNVMSTTTITLVSDVYTAPDNVEIASTSKAHGGNGISVTFTVTPAETGGTAGALMASYIRVSNGFLISDSFRDVTSETTPAPAAGTKVYRGTVEPDAGSTEALMINIAADMGFVLKSGTMMLTVPHATTPADQTPDPKAKVEGEVQLSGSIAKNGFFVIGTSAAMADSGLKTAANLTNLDIDLEEFFLNGGEILVVGPSTAKAKDVVISEIMWGSDAAKSPMTASQWIELYNTTSAAVSLAGWKLEFIAPDGTPKGVGVESDKATNLGPVGYWSPLGQSGRSSSATIEGVSHAAVDIISMYRNIDYAKVEKGDHNTDAAKNRTTQLEGVPDGRIVGSWKASTRPPLNLLGRRVGTPGAKHYLRVSTTPTALDQKVIINEIGNGSGDSNDWVELLNTTSSEINLKNWELSVVTGTNAAPKDDKLIEFPDNDNTKLPANGILLLTNTPPTDSGNDLSAGVEVDVKPEDQPKRGSTALYYPDAGLKLPDNGKFLLVLRSAKDKNAKPEAIIDAGGVLFLEVDNDTTYNTQVWPLQATAKGHGNVIDAADEAFSSGQVYQRNAKNSGIGEKHWKKVGFTGIGYDRTAAKEDSNGGTPGFPNDGLKEKVADLASNAEITISEIMFDGGPGRRQLPQWVELYNSSMTQAVNLNAWKLEIQNANSEDVDSRLNATITLKAMTVAPNETVLIASSSGLNSGSNHFPSTRLVNLWTDPDHRAALEMTSRNDKILSSTGLYLKLTDKDNKLVDAVGNLDGNKRTNDDPAWELPMSDEEGRRSSIIRRYEEGVAIDGMTSAGWVAASQTDLAYAISHTFYGSADDLGTPGFRGGGPLPVSLASFRPVRDKATGEVVIRWITQSELNNAGFNILRSETKTGEFKVVNTKGIIPGHGTTSEKHVYTWTDTTAKPNVVYYYQIEDVSLDGERTTLRTTHLRGNVNAAGKLTTYWGELKTYGK